jgi:hypothetical protein
MHFCGQKGHVDLEDSFLDVICGRKRHCGIIEHSIHHTDHNKAVHVGNRSCNDDAVESSDGGLDGKSGNGKDLNVLTELKSKLRLHLDELWQRKVIVGLGDDRRCERVHRQRVSDINIRGVSGNVVIGQNVKVVNVLSVGIGLVSDF